MFALEIQFKEPLSQCETLLVRRSQVLIGSSDQAHVVVDDMAPLQYQIQLVREVGRQFRCVPVGMSDSVQIPPMLAGVFTGNATLDLGPISMNIIALDVDLALRENEATDRAGVRVLRQATATGGPKFPAVVFASSPPTVVSFAPDQQLYIGRSGDCALRIDAPEISAKHARVSFESGQFWVEDLGSTNGTFVDSQQISGKVAVDPCTPIRLGRDTLVYGVLNQDEIGSFSKQRADRSGGVVVERRYPVLISLSEIARPARLVVPLGGSVRVGRDPSSEMWLGAPHISRQHCIVGLSKTGELSITDQSTNGTSYGDGVLKRGNSISTTGTPRVLDFGGGITVAICFTEEQERAFIASVGAPHVFLSNSGSGKGGAGRTDLAKSDTERRENILSTHLRRHHGRVSGLVSYFSNLSPVSRALVGLWVGAAITVVVVIVTLLRGIFGW